MFARRATLSDVAREAGVSAATVSRAFSQPDLLNEGTLNAVLSAAARLGYLSGGPARALVSGRSMTMGAIVPTLDSAVFSNVVQSMQRRLTGGGYQLLVASSDYSKVAEAEAVRALLSRGVDGLMLTGAEQAVETLQVLRRSGIPYVQTLRADPGADAVIVDNVHAGYLAARHLLDLGHRSIAMITGPLRDNDRQRDRVAGVRHALAEADLSLPDWLISQQPYSLAGGRMGAAGLLALGRPPTGLICGLDIQAVGCIAEAHSRGWSIPQAFSLVGIDDLEMSAHLSPPLTTVHIPTGRLGEEAADKLLARAAGGAVTERVELPVELVVRQSTGAPPERPY